jgi:hypothetical protein
MCNTNIIEIAKDIIQTSSQPKTPLKKHLAELEEVFPSFTFEEIVSLIGSGLDVPPICPVCNKNNLKPRTKSNGFWSKTCSKECADIQQRGKKINRSPEQIKKSNEKRQETNIRLYGSKTPLGNKEISDRMKQSNFEKYGSSPQSTEAVKSKVKKTTQELYGVDSYFKTDDFKNKRTKTCISKYGVDHHYKLEEHRSFMINQNPMYSYDVIIKQQETNHALYGGSGFASSVIKERIVNSIKEKYGVDNIMFSDIHKSIVIDKWYESYFRKYPRVKEVLDDIDKYLFDGMSQSDFYQKLPDDVKQNWQFFVDEQIRRGFVFTPSVKSSYEESIAEFLDTLRINYKRNDRSLISPLEIDFVAGDLCLELNGVYWHSSRCKPDKYHLQKTNDVESMGKTLLHIYDVEWDDPIKRKIWKSVIKSKLGLSDRRIFARKCKVVSVSQSDEISFLKNNHLQGYAQSSVRIGLTYNDELVCVATFGKPRFNKNYDWELIRFSSLLDTTIVGGFSKIIKQFSVGRENQTLLSYANRRWSTGNVYRNNNFDYLGNTPPSYHYLYNGNLVNRNNFQKHKLKNILENYDESLTERENTELNGIYRVYDSGHILFSTIL